MDLKSSKVQTIQDQENKIGERNESNLESDEPHKVPYPKRVFFIIANEFCERFNYYGMSTILALYLKYKLGYTENDATVLFHGFTMFYYTMCFFGGILSDVWLGKFRTILYLSIVCSFGSTFVAVSAIPNLIPSPKVNLIIGLVLIAVGSGGIKPCVSAFGGDQFKWPEQAAQITTFFSLFYFTINLGSFISTSLTPILREDVHCFGENDCFSLAFGVPAVLMLISVVFFLIGKSSYTCKKTSSENMLVQVFKCTKDAISTKIREGKEKPRRNLLDHSIDKYGEQLVGDIRILMQILLLYLPVPLFWALFDQRGSRWTFQADKMNGDLGFYTIKPDQMQVVNPLLVLIMIPLFEAVVYPILSRIGIRRPLQKMVIGRMLAAVAFLLSAVVQLKIESSAEKTVNMLWLIPQNVVITMGEIMFSITGLAFSYEQAPESMKSVVVAFWQLTNAFGNVILLFVAEANFFDKQSNEFLLFAGLMIVDMLIFIILAYNFKGNDQNGENSKDKQNTQLETTTKSIEEEIS